MTLDDDEECVKPIKTSPLKEIQTTIEDLRKDKPNKVVNKQATSKFKELSSPLKYNFF